MPCKYLLIGSIPIFSTSFRRCGRAAIAAHFEEGTLQLADRALFGSEDFSSYQEKVPGTFLFIGCGNEEKGAAWNVHNPHFRIDEAALAVGVKTHVALVSPLFEEI